MFRVIACRVIGKTQIWFIVALAAAAVADLTAPPPIVANLIRFAFVVSAALQGAIWLRELILGWVEHRAAADSDDTRSEEHTSELQSLMRISYAVFCLKKKNNNIHTNRINQKD